MTDVSRGKQKVNLHVMADKKKYLDKVKNILHQQVSAHRPFQVKQTSNTFSNIALKKYLSKMSLLKTSKIIVKTAVRVV